MSDSPSPLIRQYNSIRRELPAEALLFFRIGDFYEAFCDDAVTAAPLLGLALTKRAGAPMCGVPYHAIDTYLAKAIRAGYKCAICEQMEYPQARRGVVRREITRVFG